MSESTRRGADLTQLDGVGVLDLFAGNFSSPIQILMDRWIPWTAAELIFIYNIIDHVQLTIFFQEMETTIIDCSFTTTCFGQMDVSG